MVTREAWLAEGLAVLALDGEDGVRVDRLARRLGVTKGSFHHHFGGAADFRLALLARFESDQVAELEQLAGAHAGAPSLTVLLELVTRVAALVDTDLERAVRAWSGSDAAARGAIARVDAARLTFLQEAWRRELGDESRARSAALVPHLIAVGAAVSHPRLTSEDLHGVFDLLGSLATGLSRSASTRATR